MFVGVLYGQLPLIHPDLTWDRGCLEQFEGYVGGVLGVSGLWEGLQESLLRLPTSSDILFWWRKRVDLALKALFKPPNNPSSPRKVLPRSGSGGRIAWFEPPDSHFWRQIHPYAPL